MSTGIMSKDSVSHWLRRLELQPLQIPSEMLDKWEEEVCRRYTEEQRHYHTLQHIADMISHFEQWKVQIKNPLSVLLAIIFHEYVFNIFH